MQGCVGASAPLHRLQFIYIALHAGPVCGVTDSRCPSGQTACLFSLVNSSNRRSRPFIQRHRPSYLISRLSWRTHANSDTIDGAVARMACIVVSPPARVPGGQGRRGSGRRYPSLRSNIIPCLGGYLASVLMPMEIPRTLYLSPYKRQEGGVNSQPRG